MANPVLNFLWVGPPRSNLEAKKIESDIKSVLEISTQCPSNPAKFYCVDQYCDDYKKLFDGKNVEVVSIDQYLKEKTKSADPFIKKSAEKMIAMQKEILDNARNTIIDRVSFKDAFSLFLLACEGGYTLDTNVKLDPNENFSQQNPYTFPNHDSFMRPSVGMTAECWMMYAPTDRLLESQAILQNYLSSWDKVQNIVRKKEELSAEDKIKFHAEITGLIIQSIEDISIYGKKYNVKSIPYDIPPENKDEINAQGNAVAAKKPPEVMAVSNEFPIQKQYNNSHKPIRTLHPVLMKTIKEYEPSKNIAEFVVFRTNLKESLLKELSRINVNEVKLGDETILIDVDRIFTELKKIDKIANQYEGMFTKYNTDVNEVNLNQKMHAHFEAAYQKLNASLLEDTNQVDKIMKELKTNIVSILKEANTQYESKHPYMSVLFSSPFKKLQEDFPDVNLDSKPVNQSNVARKI